jgi:hypothetical protein
MTEPRNRWTHKADVLTAPELAAKLCIPVDWLYVQIRKGKLLADRQPSGAYLFNDSTAVLDGIQRQRNHLISCLDLRISQPHQEGHQHAPSALRLPAPDICEEGYRIVPLAASERQYQTTASSSAARDSLAFSGMMRPSKSLPPRWLRRSAS